jgi:hypothetical protein
MRSSKPDAFLVPKNGTIYGFSLKENLWINTKKSTGIRTKKTMLNKWGSRKILVLFHFEKIKHSDLSAAYLKLQRKQHFISSIAFFLLLKRTKWLLQNTAQSERGNIENNSRARG